MRYQTILLIPLLLTACGPSEQKKAELAEKRRIECLDKPCPGDVPPPFDHRKDVALKLNGQWFIGPKAYFSGLAGAVFYWPSKTPEIGLPNGKPWPEKGKPFNDVAIEIMFRSNNFPPEPRGYKFLELAESKGWIDKRENIRPGLDRVTMKHVIGPRGYYIDHVNYYTATQMTGIDGLPPVATCSHKYESDRGGTGFMWQPGIWVGVRMNQKHCADWPEIYTEISKVLQQLKKVQS